MIRPEIDVMGTGAVVLGADVVCDGFRRDKRIRVQTHIHDDHMGGFETSKGFQDLFMSEATKQLLIAEFNADLLMRDNLYVLRPAEPAQLENGSVTLFPSGHMLGSVQVLVETRVGQRLGYSGDFQWPMEPRDIIQCDALVVDSTYGSPNSVRKYSQEEAECRLLDLLHAKLKAGPVHIKAHRGTIQRALQLIDNQVDVPILASKKLCEEVRVYQKFGAGVGTVVPERSVEGTAAQHGGRFIRLYGKGDRVPVELATGTMVTLSAYMAPPHDPVLEYSERAYRVALSNHADFVGTLEYVEATGARFVVTDNTRTHGVELAVELRNRLGIEAVPSSNFTSREWGS